MSPGAPTPEMEVLDRKVGASVAHGGGPPPGPLGPGRMSRRHAPRSTWAVLLAVATAVSLLYAGVGRQDVLNVAGWPQLRRFFAAAIDPAVNPTFLRITWDATLTTLSYAILGTALAVVIGVVGGVVASETWWRGQPASPRRKGRPGRRPGRAGWVASRAALGLPRGVHEAVWGLFLISVLGLDPLVAVLAIGIPYGAVTAKVYSELIDEAPRHAYAALRTAGVGRLKALSYTSGPLASPDMLSYAFYRFECSIRGAAILGIIGAGGLGFQLALSFQSLRYEEMWTLIYALAAVCGLADWWSTALRRHRPLPAKVVGAPGVGTAWSDGGERLQLRRDRRRSASLVAAVVLVVAAALHLQVDVSTLWSDRAQRLASGIAASSFPPELGSEALATLARLSLETLAMALIATVLASIGAMAVAFVAASRHRMDDAEPATSGRPARAGPGLRGMAALATRGLLLLCRAVPPPVGALLVLFVFRPGPLPGALALAVYNFGILGRLMAEVVENLDPRPVRALRGQGASAVQAFLYGALPRALPRFAAYGLYRWEVTIRETVVVGLVGAGGLGRLLAQQLAAFDYRGVVATLMALVALTLLVDVVSSAVRRSLR